MPIHKSIFNCNLQIGKAKISKVYVGSNLVYKTTPNIFVFTVQASTKIILQNDLRGDTASFVMTDWGDGTIDSNLEHTYTTAGTYQVRTRYSLVSTENAKDNTTLSCLTKVISISDGIKTCAHMFNGCTNLTEVDCANWDMRKIIDLSYMFYNCTKLINLDCSKWDTSNVKTASYMFGYSTKQ